MFNAVGNGIVSGTLAQPGYFRVTLKFIGTAYFQWNFQSTFTTTQIILATDSNSTASYFAGGGPGSTYLFVVVSTTVLASTVLTFTGFDGTTSLAPNTIRLNFWVTQAAPITLKSPDSHVRNESEDEEDNWERLCEVSPSALRIPEPRPLVLPAAKVPSRSLSDKSLRKGC